MIGDSPSQSTISPVELSDPPSELEPPELSPAMPVDDSAASVVPSLPITSSLPVVPLVVMAAPPVVPFPPSSSPPSSGHPAQSSSSASPYR